MSDRETGAHINEFDPNEHSDHRRLERIEEKLDHLIKEQYNMSTSIVTQSAFDTALAGFQTQLNTAATSIKTAFTNLEAKIASTPTGTVPDLTAEMATLGTMTTALADLTTTAAADDPGAPAAAAPAA